MKLHRVYNNFAIFVFVCFLESYAFGAGIAGHVNKAKALYEQGKFDDAIEHYQKAIVEEPNSPLLEYNLGTTKFKIGGYSDSVQHLQKALLTDDSELQQRVRYNLANALYKQGITKEDSNLSGAIEDLEHAILHYEKNKAVSPNDPDLLHNHQFVQKELHRLKQKQQHQKQQQQQQQNKSDDSRQNRPDKSNDDQNSSGDDNNPSPSRPDQQSESKDNKTGSQENKQDNKDQKQITADSQDDHNKMDQSQSKKSAGENEQSQSQRNNSDGGQVNGQGMMTAQEAQIMLDDYQRNDEPKGMLYFQPHSGTDKPVGKDW